MGRRTGYLVLLVGFVGIITTGYQIACGSPVHDAQVTRRIVEIGKHESQAIEHLDHICNQIGARPAGSVDHQAACEWAARKFEEFGLANVHLEECADLPKGFSDRGVSGFFKRWFRIMTLRDAKSKTVPICNVIADIPGAEIPDEYVIVGAHIDSTPVGTGATDNGTGVASVMEAARILVKSVARPKRTIRFILFAGEESGLIGSRSYVEAHPDLLPKVSAMYNMDHGANYISKVKATEPLKGSMEEIFAPAIDLDPEMPFEVELVAYLPKADPNCCRTGVLSGDHGKGSPMVITQVMKRNPDGSLEQVDGDLDEFGVSADDIRAGQDSTGRRLIISGGCGDTDGLTLTEKDLAEMGIDVADLGTTGDSIKIVAVGSSDHAPFLAAGVPSFWWDQEENDTHPYPAHTKEDTFDKVNTDYLEHSATVIALGALGTANLDHMLSRERLTAPEEEAVESAPPKKTKVPRSACCPLTSGR